jgi:hypothetical protein
MRKIIAQVPAKNHFLYFLTFFNFKIEVSICDAAGKWMRNANLSKAGSCANLINSQVRE